MRLVQFVQSAAVVGPRRIEAGVLNNDASLLSVKVTVDQC
jgi:hypothetical protein